MSRFQPPLWSAFFVLSILSSSVAHSANLNREASLPLRGAPGHFAGTIGDVRDLLTGVKAKRVASAAAAYEGGTQTLRGGAEAQIYAKISPSVVLIFTDAALGTGSLISKDGQILTNYHVVAGFTKVGVLLKPAKEGAKLSASDALVADVVKVDPQADLALLKVHAAKTPLPQPIVLGDFAKVQVGDDVNAIGHPEGEAWTFTKGYVSQIRLKYQWKNEDGESHQADVIQTQTPINPGNSGGPLLTNEGQLVGVNAFKETNAEGLNFAIGVNTVRTFLAGKGLTPAAAAKAAKCEPKILFEGRSKDDDADLRAMDLLCHGKANLTIVLPDDKSLPMMAFVDMDETGKPQGVVFSDKRDGHWDISYWDTKGTGKWDTIGHHPDGEIIPSSYEPYTDQH
jgi:S1-C subfamily serine protease